MKKIFIVTLCFLMVCFPITVSAGWVTANKVLVSWDANDTSMLTSDERLTYKLYLSNVATDPDKTNPSVVGVTSETTYTITLIDKGRYRAGVQAVLQALADDGVTWEKAAESEISWSDDPAVTNGEIFGIRFYPTPDKPIGLGAE